MKRFSAYHSIERFRASPNWYGNGLMLVVRITDTDVETRVVVSDRRGYWPFGRQSTQFGVAFGWHVRQEGQFKLLGYQY